jgi:hypothetical protein
MNEANLIGKQSDRYETRELWKAGARYELRIRRHGSDESPAAVTCITDAEALKFQKEAECQHAIWDEIETDHELIASFSVKNSHSELQKLADESHRVVSFQCPLEMADDFSIIHPADEATIAQFLEQADRWNTNAWQERLASKSNQEYCRGLGRGCPAWRGPLALPIFDHRRPKRLPRCGFILLQLGDASHQVVLAGVADLRSLSALGSTMEVTGDLTAKIADFHD